MTCTPFIACVLTHWLAAVVGLLLGFAFAAALDRLDDDPRPRHPRHPREPKDEHKEFPGC